MALTNGYMTVSELKAAIGDDSISDKYTVAYETAIESASRLIDYWCDPKGTRHFWSTLTPAPRRFHAKNAYVMMPGFFSTEDDLIVKTDGTGNGVFESTWSPTDYQAQPGARPNGEAFMKITTTGLRKFPVNGRRECIEITAVWGWTQVPLLVKQACRTIAIALYRSKDFTGGDVGFDGLEKAGGWDVYQLAQSLIERYMLCPPDKNKEDKPSGYVR